MRKPTFFTCFRDESLPVQHSINGAVAEFCDNCDGVIPDEITVYGYALKVPNPDVWADYVLTDLLESLDEEYVNWEVENTKPTVEMKKAAIEFVKAVLDEYCVWVCEKVFEQKVMVADYYTPS